MIKLGVSLVCGCGLGLRSAVKVLRFLNEIFDLGYEEIPCHNSLQNWVEKSGYYVYTHSELKSEAIPYGIILDESIQIGTEKLLLSLGVGAEKTNPSALKINDVEVLDISVAKSWNGDKIGQKLKETTKHFDKTPVYVISDNAPT